MALGDKILSDFRKDIDDYCTENGLSIETLNLSWKSASEDDVFILGPGDPERGKLGLADNVPLPIALKIFLEDGKLRFEQTEHTRKYLGVETNA